LKLEYKSIDQPVKDYLSINVGWAVGIALGVWVSGGISGGHINPAVSLHFFIHL
jgi:aquaglyceroporin related protein, other eukaryote